MKMTEANDRLWALTRYYCIPLRNAGYVELHINKPHSAINHVHRKRNPNSLHKRMIDPLSKATDEDFHKES